jgi:predicted ATPase
MEVRTGTGDIRQDQAFFGREEELRRVLKNLNEGRHTLLVGQYGIGKSSLMQEARLLLTGAKHRVEFQAGGPSVEKDRVLTVSSPAPLGDCLREMAGGLHRNRDLRIESADEREDWAVLKKRFTHLGIQGMQSDVLKSIVRSRKKYLVFVTNLDRIPQSSLQFFQSLLQITVVCGSAMATKDLEAFRGFWASFERVPVERLPGPVAVQLICYLMQHYPVNVVDPLMVRKEILGAREQGDPRLPCRGGGPLFQYGSPVHDRGRRADRGEVLLRRC